MTGHIYPVEVLDELGLDYKEANGSSGEQLNVKECPVCGNRKWKVYLNADNGYGNCFVCDETFNVWTFTKAALATNDNREVGRFLSKFETQTSYKPKPKRKAPKVQEGEVELPSHIELPSRDGGNLKYLEARGFNADLVSLFRLKYCIMGHFKAEKEDGDVWYQDFSSRVIIPVYDLRGNLVTFQGRDITGKSDRKYLFPVGLPSTGRFLFNGHVAFNGCREILIGEGAFDVMAQQKAIDAFPADFDGVVPVGTFGKKLSSSRNGGDSQLSAISELKEKGMVSATVMWDGEQNALESALDACKSIRGLGLTAKIAFLPKGKDPNEVDAKVVRDAFVNSTTYSDIAAMKLRLSSPYR